MTMGRFTGKLSKPEIAALLTPVAMVVTVFAMPVQSDNSGDPVPMTFDSVGAMLQDMDREKSLSSMERYANLPRIEAFADAHACDTEDLNNRLQEVYAGLQDRIAQIDTGELNRLERSIEERKARGRQEMSRRSAEVVALQARRAAKTAAEQLRVTITALEKERARAVAADERKLTRAVEAALRAAEAALANAP